MPPMPPPRVVAPLQPPPSPATAALPRATPRPSPRHELRAAFCEKVFVARESLLTTMSSSSQGETARAALHIACAAMCWIAVHLLLKENRSSGVAGVGVAALQLVRGLGDTAGGIFGVRGTASALLCSAALHVLAALAVPLLQLLTRGGSEVPSRARFAACFALYAALQVSLLGVGVATCLLLRLPPAAGLICTCEATRLAMKVHAFAREKVVHGITALAEARARGRLVAADAAAEGARRGAARSRSELLRKRGERRAALCRLLGGPALVADAPKGPTACEAACEAPSLSAAPLRLPPFAAALVRFRDFGGPGGRTLSAYAKAAQPRVRLGGWREELRRFSYFAFAPTMVYRDTYPRLPRADALGACGYAAKFSATLVFCLFVLRGMVVPALASLQSARPATLASYFIVVFDMMSPSALLFLGLFFAVLHSWLNLFASALSFADRSFYASWWTSLTWGAWYRRWNIVVGEWIRTYVYTDLQRLGAPQGLALAAVFLVSGAVHEAILAVSFGFLLPALFIFFTGPGVALLWLTRLLPPRAANVFLWLALSLGVALLFTIYADEGVLRSADSGLHQLHGAARLYDAIVPRSLRLWWAAASKL
jgi:hypothetical protein